MKLKLQFPKPRLAYKKSKAVVVDLYTFHTPEQNNIRNFQNNTKGSFGKLGVFLLFKVQEKERRERERERENTEENREEV